MTYIVTMPQLASQKEKDKSLKQFRLHIIGHNMHISKKVWHHEEIKTAEDDYAICFHVVVWMYDL